MDLLLVGGLVYDGAGNPPVVRDVGIADGLLVVDPADIVAAIDAAGSPPVVRDVAGLVVCPGFVDIHTHSDLTLLSNPLGGSKIHQGVTTEVVGNCGLGLTPLPDPARAAEPGGAAADLAGIRDAVGYLDLDPQVSVGWRDMQGYLATVAAAGPAQNVAALVPHLSLHAGVVGLDDRPVTEALLADMVDLLDTELAAGAVGLSTGLVYAPLCYVEESELMALGEVVARHGKLFAWHIRDYADDLMPSVRQAIRVATSTGCRLQISHLTAVGRRNWGAVNDALAAVDAARAAGIDVGVDIYPYLAGNCPLSQLLPDWAQEGGGEVFAPRLRDPEVRARVIAHWAETASDWNDIVVNAVNGRRADDPANAAFLGETVAALASAAGTTGDEVALDLLAEYGASVMIVAYGRSEADLRAVLAHPATVVASDGQALDPAGPTGAAGQPHPRSYGCFPRYLSRYADDLADGIRRCTSAPAARVGLADRGLLADGHPADLVVFDPSTLADTATFDDPQQFAAGITMVVVNGQVVLDDGADTGARPGQVLTT
ncbi:N-acyl-D-amino-acid deacylase family protein [Nakamurella lactea]|uniref:N-acyl-D-amino-acid deacylase family protein n=1 Tax=Nakamurella lactea TaxID=459515 RepID=UPI00040FC4D4|nr:amidohydrolase family protein [Nakamurella lactea]